jgi:uncharacterized delta-60 repeat protein
LNSAGTLDTAFGTSGKVITDTASGTDFASGVTIQADGKIVVGGGHNGTETGEDFAAYRYHPNGALDETFDGDGIAITNLNLRSGTKDPDTGFAIAMQGNDKIVLAGAISTSLGIDFGLIRYSVSNGSVDTTFGNAGVATTNIGASISWDEAHAIAVQADGKLVLGGFTGGTSNSPRVFALARYMADGNLDPAFGTGGIVTTDIPNAEDDRIFGLAIQADGKIVAAGAAKSGTSGYDFTAARYWGGDLALAASSTSEATTTDPIVLSSGIEASQPAIQSAPPQGAAARPVPVQPPAVDFSLGSTQQSSNTRRAAEQAYADYDDGLLDAIVQGSLLGSL